MSNQQAPSKSSTASSATSSADNFFEALNNNAELPSNKSTPSLSDTGLSSDTSFSKSAPAENGSSPHNASAPPASLSGSYYSLSKPKQEAKLSDSLSPDHLSLIRQGRKRSNSKSRRQHNPIPPSLSSLSLSDSISQNAPSSPGYSSLAGRTKIDRSQLQYNLILVSLNGTFEKKSLIIPFRPDALKLGRPATTKIQPTSTNGYFDSRVLSRNHAELFADVSTGKLFIKDLGSSNGTFVNENKIASERDSDPTEIKKGDVIDLGFDIESHQNHRKISARVENILIRPLVSNSEGLVANIIDQGGDASSFISSSNNALSSLFEIRNDVKNSILSNSFDAALFGDILPNFEDNVLNIKNDSMTGLSINSNLTTSSNLEFQIKTLINEIHLIKNSIMKTKTIEVFLKKYIKNLKKIEIEKNEANKNKVKDYEQQLVKKYEKEFFDKKAEIDKRLLKTNENFKYLKLENDKILKSLKNVQANNTSIEANLKSEKGRCLSILNENNSLKNSLESKTHELNDWQIRFTELEAKYKELQSSKVGIDKEIQTEPRIPKRYPKSTHNVLNDNDSDSSTLNDDDINLQRINKSLNPRDNENGQLDSSGLGKNVYTRRLEDETRSDNDKVRPNGNFPCTNSDEDLSNLVDRNNIITDEKAISTGHLKKERDGTHEKPLPSLINNGSPLTDGKPIEMADDDISSNSQNQPISDMAEGVLAEPKTEDPKELEPRHNALNYTESNFNPGAPLEGKMATSNGKNSLTHEVTQEAGHKFEELLSKVEALQLENSSIREKLHFKEEKLVLLEDQLSHLTHGEFFSENVITRNSSGTPIHSPWSEGNDGLSGRNGFSTSFASPLTRSPSNASITSSSSRALPQSPLFGLFGPNLSSINKLRSRSLASRDFEDSFDDIDEDSEHARQSPVDLAKTSNGTGMFIKPESTKTSIVTAVGIVVISIMVSRFSK